MKTIYYLPLLLMLIASCDKENKTQLQKESVSEPTIIPLEKSLFDIPWADPALLAVTNGC